MYTVQSRYMQQADESVKRRLTPNSGTKKKSSHTHMASTPAFPTSGTALFNDCNVSAIQSGSIPATRKPAVKKALGPSLLDVPKFRKPNKTTPTVLGTAPDIRSSTPVPTDSADISGATSDLTPLLLEILHSKVVLADYLVKEEKSYLEAMEKDGLNDLWALSRMNSELIEEKTKLANQLKDEEHLLRLDKDLSLQKNSLEAISSELQDMIACLRSTTNSLNACRAEIPVNNIILPVNQDELISELNSVITSLETALEECKPVGTELQKLTTILPSLISTLKSAEEIIPRSSEQAEHMNRLESKKISVLTQRIQEIMLSKLMGNLLTNFKN